ncbi:MAG: helix-turn-helix domain-containing protein [Acidimicrobiia bacterium]
MSGTPGQLIRDARRRARLSQTDLARRAGVAQSVISA